MTAQAALRLSIEAVPVRGVGTEDPGQRPERGADPVDDQPALDVRDARRHPRA
jgi:hypothetical protein